MDRVGLPDDQSDTKSASMKNMAGTSITGSLYDPESNAHSKWVLFIYNTRNYQSHNLTVKTYDLTVKTYDLTVKTNDLTVKTWDLTVETYDLTVKT